MEQSVPPSDEIERRVRAAAGYSKLSLEAFADATGISKSNIYRVFDGKRHFKRMELREMAAYANLPIEFFTADFSLLTVDSGASQIERAMTAAGRDARDRHGESLEGPEATENPSR